MTSRNSEKFNKKRKISIHSETSSDCDNGSKSKTFYQICKFIYGTYWNHDIAD